MGSILYKAAGLLSHSEEDLWTTPSLPEIYNHLLERAKLLLRVESYSFQLC